MKSRIHAVAGVLAIILVTTFMAATIVVEIVGDPGAVLAVKTLILYALLALVPSIMIAGGSGRSLASGRTAPVFRRKKRRTAAVAMIGLFVLVPSAFVLRDLAAVGDFGTTFVAIQAAELLGGAVNLTLLALNARDGRKLTSARRTRGREEMAVTTRA